MCKVAVDRGLQKDDHFSKKIFFQDAANFDTWLSDEICSLLMHVFVEIYKNAHKNNKLWLILKKFRALENNSKLPGYT